MSTRESSFSSGCTTALPMLVLLAALGAAASAQVSLNPPVERTHADAAGGRTEHFSIDQHGPRYNPIDFVSVGAREIPGLGQGLHIVRYNAGHNIIGEALFVPPGSFDIVGYSVDTVANGDLLVAGEIDDQYSGTGLLNTFVSLISNDLSTVFWTKLLPGTLNRRPAVTARELNDGTFVVVHNEWPDYGGDIGPSFARISRLDAVGNLIWSRLLAVPNAPLGQLGFLDVAQEPGPNGNLWAAGWCSSFLTREALLLNIDLASGCPLGEGGWKYPHPAFEQTWLTAVRFDRRPDGSFTMVAAGAAVGLDISDIPRPRVLEVPAFGGAANWDHVFDVYMVPAPTALVVTRGSFSYGPVPVTVAGTFMQWLSPVEEARVLKFSTNTPGAAQAWAFGNGSPPDTRFNDIADGQVMIGGRETNPAPADLYYAGRGVSSCAEPLTAADLGPGTLGFVYPDCYPQELISDLQLMSISTTSLSNTICTYRPPPLRSATKFELP
jgi:hypothetical protein